MPNNTVRLSSRRHGEQVFVIGQPKVYWLTTISFKDRSLPTIILQTQDLSIKKQTTLRMKRQRVRVSVRIAIRIRDITILQGLPCTMPDRDDSPIPGTLLSLAGYHPLLLLIAHMSPHHRRNEGYTTPRFGITQYPSCGRRRNLSALVCPVPSLPSLSL